MFNVIPDTIIGVFGETLDKFFPDQNKKIEAITEIRAKLLENEAKIVAAAGSVVEKEIQSEKWWQNAWRPAFMWIIIFIIFNNFILAPYIEIFFGVDYNLNVDVENIPAELWRAIDIGLGGYIIGRSAEKIATNIQLPAPTPPRR